MKRNTARNELERACDLEDRGEFRRAFDLYLKAAKNGNIEAQVNLANFYDEGKVHRRDSEKAVYWYKRAIRAGSAEGAYNLAVHYRQHGKHRWARYWFERAAAMGDDDARIEVLRNQ